ncbi:MAG: cryptochrome/photolyase family protein [Deltaproteobacteria bacterium]|nr:cryptochrome/photolyase family protein [Deltaproteobacteria bacterium]
MTKSVLVLMGNQLFPKSALAAFRNQPIYMAEDLGLCTYFRFHKAKIALFLGAMRQRRDELRNDGFSVYYHELNEDHQSYEERLIKLLKAESIKQVDLFEIEDRPFALRLAEALKVAGVAIKWHQSPMFLTSRDEFKTYLQGTKKPFMKTFYEWQRRRLNVLMTTDGDPVGGRWSFDTENRNRLPKGLSLPSKPISKPTAATKKVLGLVEKQFKNHPGSLDHFALTISRDEALRWLGEFLEQKLDDFGPYEDAITKSSAFVFHSVLSPALNLGLITPREVIDATLKAFKAARNPSLIASVEGFVRQVIGWREFIRGIDQNYGTKQETTNFFAHERRLTPSWYEGSTGIPILDDSIKKVLQFGYTHHIERLMILSNLMLLSEIHPQDVYRWFMEMFVDSSDWVMGPNVYGMGQHSDGGIFATKPYICGSNYLLKMSDYESGDWTDIVDGLYWRFIDRKREYYLRNPRTSMAVRQFDKIADARKKKLAAAADKFLAEHTSI